MTLWENEVTQCVQWCVKYCSLALTLSLLSAVDRQVRQGLSSVLWAWLLVGLLRVLLLGVAWHAAAKHHCHIHHWVLLIICLLAVGRSTTSGLLKQVHLHHLLVVWLDCLLLHDNHLLVVDVLLLQSHLSSGGWLRHHRHHRHHGHHTWHHSHLLRSLS